MKTKIFLLVLLQILSIKIFGGTISGEISYSGSSTGTIVILAFPTPQLDTDPAYMTTISQTGSYSLEDVADGTYYIISVIINDPDQVAITDPYGFWGTDTSLTPVEVAGSDTVSGIDINLIDGTMENPNPFATFTVNPDRIIQLPSQTMNGKDAALVFDGTSIYLYEYDYEGAASGKIFVINPESGALINTIILSLESSPNKISWIDRLVFRNGVLWAKGGYGDPLGSGGIDGVFQMDIASNSSSSQKPYSQAWAHKNGLACDGTNLFIGLADSNGIGGVVKFNPDAVSSIPSNLFINSPNRVKYLCYGDNFLWVGIDSVYKYDPVTGVKLGTLRLQGSAAQLYFDNKFWSYKQSDNTIRVYNLSSVSDAKNDVIEFPNDYLLSQNYPNPFNPSTKISWQSAVSDWQSLKVYDILGNQVATLVDEYRPAGSYEVEFNGSSLASGVYYYQLKSGEFIQTKKMIQLK